MPRSLVSLLATLLVGTTLASCGGGGGGGGFDSPALVTLTTTSVADGATGQPYVAQFEAVFPNDPGNFFVSGGDLPAGLALDENTGVLSGYPRQVGTFHFEIAARDGEDKSLPPGRDATYAESRRVFTVVMDRGPVQILPQQPPAAQYRAAYSYSIDAAGGYPPYTFAQSGGTLPPGLTVSPDGILGNFPTQAILHPYPFDVTVTDSIGQQHTASLTVDVVVLPLILQTAQMPDASEGFPYDQPIELASPGGGAPYGWSQATPAPGETALTSIGMEIDPDGHVVSVAGPTVTGTFLFTVKVVDEAGQTASRQISIKVRTSPVIYTIDPKSAAKPGPFTVTGTKFEPGAQLVFAPGAAQGVVTPTWMNASTLTFLSPPSLSVAGPVTVRVVNPDGGSYDKVGGMLYPASNISFGQKGFIPSALSSFGLAAADVTGDGKVEVIHAGSAGFKPFSSYALTSSAGGLHYLKNNGDLSFTPTILSGTNCTDCKFADLDGDGDLDIVALATTSILSYLNDGAGNFSTGPVSAIPNPIGSSGSGSYTSEMAVGFLDANSIPDLAWGSGNWQLRGQAYMALGTGTGAFTLTASATSIGSNSFYGVNSLTFTKANGDSVDDLVATPSYYSSATPHLRYSLNGAAGTFGAWTATGANTLTWGGVSSVRSGNFQNRGAPCVVVSTTQDPPDSAGTKVGGSQLYLYAGSGFSTQVALSIPAGLSKSIGVGDFDFDGIDDFAVSAKVATPGSTNPPTTGTPGLVYVYRGTTGVQSTTLNIATGTPTVTVGQSGRVCSGDIDGDGRPDILISTSYWATDNQRSTTFQRGDSCDGNPLGIVFYLNSSN